VQFWTFIKWFYRYQKWNKIVQAICNNLANVQIEVRLNECFEWKRLGLQANGKLFESGIEHVFWNQSFDSIGYGIEYFLAHKVDVYD